MCNPYYTLNDYCRKTYGQKVYKLSLDAGLTCPNRDGSLGTKGCIFCSAGGSGDFAIRIGNRITGLFPDAACLIETAGKNGSLFIAYFQAFTNTYGPIDYLESIYDFALSKSYIAGISIGTRPDCISEEVLLLLEHLTAKYPDKFIWIELGLQSIHEKTAAYIRRGYSYSCFLEAYAALNARNIPVILHLILGLPGETQEDMFATVQAINKLHPFGIKLQLLHVLKYTDLAIDFENGLFDVLSLEEYVQIVATCLGLLSPDITIHRVTGDGPKDITIAPTWSFHKKNVLNTLHKYLKEHKMCQGCLI